MKESKNWERGSAKLSDEEAEILKMENGEKTR